MKISCVGEWFFMRSSKNEFFRSPGPLGMVHSFWSVWVRQPYCGHPWVISLPFLSRSSVPPFQWAHKIWGFLEFLLRKRARELHTQATNPPPPHQKLLRKQLLREAKPGGFQTRVFPTFFGKGPDCVADPFGTVPRRC